MSEQRYFYQGDGQLVAQTEYKNATSNIKTRIRFDEADMRDAADKQLSYRYEKMSNEGRTLYEEQVYQTTYVLFDDYKQSIQTVSKNGATSGTGFGRTSFDYAGTGELVAAYSTGGAAFNRHYTSNRFGQMITRSDRVNGDWKGTSYYYLNGSALLNAGQPDNNAVRLAGGFESLTKADMAQTPGSYVTSTGDTSLSVARALYGDDSYAYLIADANGIADTSTAITEGTSLLIPNVLTNSYNAHDTVKPYNPSDVIGNTTPVPKPKPPKGNFLVQLIMAVIAIVVTLLTWGAGAGIAASLYASGSALAATAVTGATLVVSGMAGSVVSQQVGDKWLGQGPLDWDAVGKAGVTNFLTAGLGPVSQQRLFAESAPERAEF